MCKKGKTEKMITNTKPVDPVMWAYIFNYVSDAIRQELSTSLQNVAINRNTQIEWHLDMGPMALAFFIEDLEKKTLLDLNVQLDNLYTVGDVCNLVAERLQTANKLKLVQQISKNSLQHYLIKNLAVPQK